VIAIDIDPGSGFSFRSVYEPAAVQFVGGLSVQKPDFNSGVTYFDVAGNFPLIDPKYQLRVVPSSSPQSFPLTLEGFAWNDPWGWISFGCSGGNNRGQACTGSYQTQIEMPVYMSLAPYGFVAGQGWNPNIGEVDFSWTCPVGVIMCSIAESSPLTSKKVRINFNTGLVSGYAWNESIGWMYMQGYIDPIPTLTGFTCGNGTREGLEECDDGNSINDDACTNSCLDNVCGDGIPSSAIGEQCDDGNIVPGDGCDDTCQLESGAAPVCGDGVPNPGEECDEGWVYDRPLDSIDDGECVIDNNTWECKINRCGDGYLWSTTVGGTEECDDGGVLSGDGCSPLCLIEPPIAICGDGTTQPNGADGLPGTPDDEQCDLGSLNRWDGKCLPNCKKAQCGDTYLYPSQEQCDDGNSLNGDGCDNQCKKEPGAPPPVCGDGSTTSPETCDDGNTESGDGCDNVCQLELSCIVCGDGCLNPYTEECDDGNLYSGDGCDSLCNDEDPGAICGNSIQEPNSPYGGDEECDDGNTVNGDGCSKTCKIESEYCGDGVTNGSEECDDGNSNNDDTCTNSCLFGNFGLCGNGFEDFGEGCDDGNTVSGDGCSAVCTEETIAGPEEPTEPFVSINDCDDVVNYFSRVFNLELDPSVICEEYCGNGYLEDGEECEDGNTANGDGCSATCIDEEVGAVCGNAIQEIGEGCDDGNNQSGDGCDAYCEDEEQVVYLDNPTCEELFDILSDILGIDLYAGGYCNSVPSYCGDANWDVNTGEECDWSDAPDMPGASLPYDPHADDCNYWCELIPEGWCGDGVQDAGEECDDGNYQDGDGCDMWCDYEFVEGYCGDGDWNLGEECDSTSGGVIPAGYDCTLDSCELIEIGAVCGNGTQETGEACDDNNTLSGDGCSPICEIEPDIEPLTCFPFTNVVHVDDTIKGDRYDIYVQLNCVEEPLGVASPWIVTIDPVSFDARNTVDCDQTDALNDRDCVIEEVTTPVELTERQVGMSKIGEVYSFAPTGYVSSLDDENTYKLNSVNVKITDGPSGPVLFNEPVSVDHTMEFEPKVESKVLDATYGSNTNVPYLNIAYNQPVAFKSQLQKNVAPGHSLLSNVRAIYELSVGAPVFYDFEFDVNRNGVWTDASDGPNLTRSRGSWPASSPNWTALNPLSSWNYPAKITGASDFGPPEGVKLDMAITYEYTIGSTTRTVTYMADTMPDLGDFRVDGSEAQISGPVNTDKLSSSSSIISVGNIGEAVQRKAITQNIGRLVQSSQLTPTAPANVNFDVSVPTISEVTGGDSLSYVMDGLDPGVDDQYVYYFKNDVTLLHSGGMNNQLNRSIIVEGADVYIDSDIFNDPLLGNPNNEEAHFEIVALRGVNGQGGNVFIAPTVTYINANIVADGSMFPYDGSSKSGAIPDWDHLDANGHLDHQLTFVGSLVSNNTLGGSLGCPTDCFRGDGSITTDEAIAKIYDMNFFRRHGLMPGNPDSAGNPQDCDGDITLEINGSYIDAPICGSGEPNSSDLVPAGLRWSGRAADDNYGLYFEYRAPSKSSVIFN